MVKHYQALNNSGLKRYVFFTEKSLLFIEAENLEKAKKSSTDPSKNSVQQIPHGELKEIRFADNKERVDFRPQHGKTHSLQFSSEQYKEVKNQVLEQLNPTRRSEIRLWPQLSWNMLLLYLVVDLVYNTYQVSLVWGMSRPIDRHVSPRGGMRYFFYQFFYEGLAEILGSAGVLLLGIPLIAYLVYRLYRKLAHPDYGEIFKFSGEA